MDGSAELQTMKKLLALAVITVVLGLSAWARENTYEFTVQGSGLFPKETTTNALTNKPTSSGGVMTGFRVNLSNRFAFEGDYDYFRNSDKFSFGSGLTRIPMNVHAITGVGIVTLPVLKSMKPFALAGGGMILFDPRGRFGDGSQARSTFVYGGGVDVPIMKHVALRAEYRGFVYKIPDFDTSTLKMDRLTHAAVPSAGIVFTF